jgi:hypothetical protein
VRSELRQRGFSWSVLPESSFIEDAAAIQVRARARLRVR